MNDRTPRWLDRFSNYKRAFLLLSEATDSIKELNQLEKEGYFKRFEFTFELAWKIMNDYLKDEEGVLLPIITPRTVIRAAIEAGLIKDGQVWMEALDTRKKMFQTYDFSNFDEAIVDISQRYFAAMANLHNFFLGKEAEYVV
jgi:nucleotidyltransferase substrate binding protein (TIGR01987 family)